MTETMNLNSIQQIAARKIFELTGKDMSNPRDYNEVKRHVIDRNNRITAGWGKQHELFKNGEYINNSLFSGGQRLDFSFKDWKPEMQAANIDKAKYVGNKCYKLARMMINHPLKVVLSGDPGVGKTSLAMAMLNYMAAEGFSVMVVSTTELSHLLDNRYEADDVKNKLWLIEKMMKNVDVLLLDDLGTEGMNGQEVRTVRKDMSELLFRVANARLDLKRNEPVHSVITTTNCDSEKLYRLYGEKTISRLTSRNPEQIVDFSGLKNVRR